MIMVAHFVIPLMCFVLVVLAPVPDQSGFISIDCGLSDKDSYVDDRTNLYYVSDAKYLNTDNGVSKALSPIYQTFVANSFWLDEQFLRVRSFPSGTKNCYTLTPPHIEGRSSHYFVRARFLYGNYDDKSQFPIFDIYLGVDYWDTIEIVDVTKPINKEMLHIPSNSSDDICVCLVNTGQGTPFISALEIRLVDDDIYKTETDSLLLQRRLKLVTMEEFYKYNSEYVFRDLDGFDRMWKIGFLYETIFLRNNLQRLIMNAYKLPFLLTQTSLTPETSDAIEFHWQPPDPTAGYYVYMHFADTDQSNITREFNITINDKPWYSNFDPRRTTESTIASKGPETPASDVKFTLIKTSNSVLGPILTAYEIFIARKLSNQLTNKADMNALQNIKVAYGLKKDWQGDPCLPAEYLWESIGCFNISPVENPRIIFLNLSQHELKGKISPSIFNLKMIRHLDLSNNSLTGEVPMFLTEMEHLDVLILSGNQLSGVIPAKLIEKWKNGSLALSVGGNPNLCAPETCYSQKKNNNVVAIIAGVASVAVLLLFLSILLAVILLKKKRSSERQGQVIKKGTKNFTYSEIMIITNNLETIIGRGGFGPVYKGYLEDAEVAVKMLSSSSFQGYKEFCAEIEFLTRVHHVNLTALVGYCDGGENIGLIYEYMSNGNLKDHLSERYNKVLSWEERLHIAIDAATGLEYLHHGCKPPIIHRDVKSSNILLDEKFRAKLADFGLSKDFPSDNTHVSTAVVGTPGYLDPEYIISCKLTEKSDIFSFGVVLLELITGRPVLSRDPDNTHVIQWVSFMLTDQNDIKNILDPKLRGDYVVNSLQKATDVALACTSSLSIQRPSTSHVVTELKHCLAIEMARIYDGSVDIAEGSRVVASLNTVSGASLTGQ